MLRRTCLNSPHRFFCSLSTEEHFFTSSDLLSLSLYLLSMALPRFFTIFLSHYSSEFMVIPESYHDELPLVLPKKALLQGSGGSFWKVAMLKRRNEVSFGQGWPKFVEDNRLRDGDILTFIYDGSHHFKVSIYGGGGCKEARVTAQVVAIDDDDDDKVDSVCDLSSDEDTNTCSEPEMATTDPRTRTRNNGKKRVVVDDSDESFMSEDSNISDTSYVTPTVAISRKKKGKSRSVKSVVGSTSRISRSAYKTQRPPITNPEAYLDDPKNIFFQTVVKNRIYELLVDNQLVKDYCLTFQDYVYYIDNHKDGDLEARTARWNDKRMCIKRWNLICERNGLKTGDRILCELLREEHTVYAIKIHILPTEI